MKLIIREARECSPVLATSQLGISDLCWQAISTDLDGFGCARLESLLSKEQCRGIASLYPDDNWFRSRVVMARHSFGKGEYKYFRYPLPDLIAQVRTGLYPKLAVIANRWNEEMKIPVRFPMEHNEFLARCHRAGQDKPTPLLLRYGEGDYNCLHQDLYGEHAFPLQVVILLSEPGADFDGGELVLVEQRPRAQSAARVVALRRGDAAIIATHHRPQRGARGWHRVNLRHGVSRVLRGRRCTAGLIFHDAAGPADG